MISILTLNLWRYYDFYVRLPNIVKAIQDNQSDVVFLQEVQINPSVSPFSQVEMLKNQLPEYKYSVHSTIYRKDSQQGKKLERPIQHGMAVLSKHPIMNSFEFFVTPNDGEVEPRSMLCFDVEIGQTVSKFANVHFANREDWAKSQLEEFLAFLESRGEKRILAGDFNMFKLSEYALLSGYKLSYDYRAYDSYPKDGGCLDYVAIPDNLSFSKMELLDEYLSDHKGLLASFDEA